MTRLVPALLLLAESCLSACAPVRVGPFPEPNAKPCAHEAACAPGTACRFPRVDSHAVCVRTRPGYDDVLDNMPNEPQ